MQSQHLTSNEQTQEDPGLALWSAAYDGDVEQVKKLLEENININVDFDFCGATPLIAAIVKDHIGIVEELLKHHADINRKFYQTGTTPLFEAVCQNNDELVLLLLKYGALIDEFSTGQGTALFTAVNTNRLSLVKILIDAGCNVNLCHSIGCSPLFLACQSGNIDIVQALLDAKAIVDLPNQNEKKFTPLCIAAQQGHVPIIEILVKAGANVNYASPIGTTPLQIAHINNKENAANKLLELGAEVDVSQSWLEHQFIKYTSYIDYKKFDRTTLDRFCKRMQGGICSGWTLRWLINGNDALRQSVAEWDGSKDNLTKELKEYFEQFSQVQWLNQADLYLIPELNQMVLDKLLNFISEDNRNYHIPFSFGFVMTRDE